MPKSEHKLGLLHESQHFKLLKVFFNEFIYRVLQHIKLRLLFSATFDVLYLYASYFPSVSEMLKYTTKNKQMFDMHDIFYS